MKKWILAGVAAACLISGELAHAWDHYGTAKLGLRWATVGGKGPAGKHDLGETDASFYNSDGTWTCSVQPDGQFAPDEQEGAYTKKGRALKLQLGTDSETAHRAWLLAHAENLTGQDLVDTPVKFEFRGKASPAGRARIRVKLSLITTYQVATGALAGKRIRLTYSAKELLNPPDDY